MSLTAPIPYAIQEMNKLGFTEWEEPFDFENIPSTILDGAFHISMGEFIGDTKDNIAQSIDAPISVRCFFKGFRTVKEARDTAILRCNEIIADFLNPTNFKSFSPPITGVFFDSGAIEPLNNELNDNVVIAVLTFTVRIYICVE